MARHEHKVILITGASSGIGRACAVYLTQRGHCVYGTSRRPRPDDLPFTMLHMDVTDDASVQQTLQTILEQQGQIDAVVNNAGIGYGGAVEDTAIAEARATLETNFLGALRVCQAVLPTMRAQGSGTIINVSSIGGLMGLPYQGLYSASKYALEGLSEALRMEVKAFGVHVVLLEPGDIRTEFTANRRNTSASGAASAYHEAYTRILQKIESDERNGAQPEAVARTVARIVETPAPRARYVVGPFYEKLAVLLKRLTPDALFEWIMRLNYGVK